MRARSSRPAWVQIAIAVLIILLVLAVAVSRLLPRPRVAPGTPTPTPQSSSSRLVLPDIPSMVGTEVAVLSYIPPPTPTPWPTPVQDLAMLVQQADVIAQAKIIGTNGAMNSFMY